MNNYSGSGRVCVTPHAGRTATNTDFVKFIVEAERPKGKDGTVSTDRINCGAWGNIAKYAQYIEEGDIVEFTGPIMTMNYQKEGKWINTWEINLKTLRIIKKEVGSGANQQRQPVPAQPARPTPPPVIPDLGYPEPPPENYFPFDMNGGF